MSWLSRRQPRGVTRTNPIRTVATVLIVGLLAVVIASSTQGYAQQWATRDVASRAIAQLEARLLDGVGAEDFAAPPSGQASPLAARLDGLLAGLRGDDASDVVQVNVYARDGTVLLSGQPERVGRKVLPARVPRLAGALAGTVNTRLLILSSVDDADLADRYTEVLAVYAPISRAGRIVAAAEIYADPTPIRLARLGTWVGVVGVATLGLLLFLRMHQAEQADQLERLTREAFFDSLTGLANRAFFDFRLQQAFHRAERRGELLVVMFLDLDRFKQVNDTLGHAAGDALLVTVGERLLASVRPEDTVARLGGDEFTVLLESVPSLADATVIAERALESMRAPFILAGKGRSVRTSIGIAARTAGHAQPADVLRDADAALYDAKAAGKDRYAIFTPRTDPALVRAS